jgi:hypothetical protein
MSTHIVEHKRLQDENKLIQQALDTLKSKAADSTAKAALVNLIAVMERWEAQAEAFMKEVEASRHGRIMRQRKELRKLNKLIKYLRAGAHLDALHPTVKQQLGQWGMAKKWADEEAAKAKAS